MTHAHPLEYCIVDVFTENALTGNPLAVVVDTIGLSSERMLAIAREFNLSETTFIQRRAVDIEQTEGVRVRIFTTQEELPFAGHPTLGTATMLRELAPEALRGDTLTLALNVGPVPVRFEQRSGTLFGEMTQRDPEFAAELDRAEVARLCGLTPADLHPLAPPQVVSTGTPFAIVPLHSAEALARLCVRQQEATAWLRARGARWFFVLGPTGAESPAFRARMQFNGGEDPATGSAAGCAISYLVRHALVESDQTIHLQQGVEIHRASDLYLRAAASSTGVVNVRVGGSTVLVAKGHLFLP